MISVNRKTLIAALDPCAAVADPRATIHAIAHVLIQASGRRLSYRATNLRVEIAGSIEATGDGSFAVGARDLLSSIGSLEGETVKLSLDKSGQLSVSGEGKRKFRLPTLGAEEFPHAMNIGGDETTCESGVLQSLIRGVSFAARVGQDKPEQSVVRIDGEKGKARAAATDGGATVAFLTAASKAKLGVSVPLEICKVIAAHDGEVGVVSGGTAVAFVLGEVRVSAAIPAGEFPPLDRAVESIPQSAGSVTVDAKKLSASIKAIRGASSDIVLRFGGPAIRLSATGEREATDEVEATETGEECELWVDADRVVSALAVVDGAVELSFGGHGLAPLQIRQGDWRVWVMPKNPEYVRKQKGAAA